MPAVKGCHSMAPGFLGLLRVPIDSTEGSSVLPPHYCAVQSTPPKCEIQEQVGILVGGLANTPYPTSLMRDYQCDLVGRTAGAFGVKRRSYNGQKSSDFAFSSAIWRNPGLTCEWPKSGGRRQNQKIYDFARIFPDLAEFLQKITPCPTQISTEMN